METKIRLDDRLLDKAKQLSHIQSTEEIVQQALERYVAVLQNYQKLMDMRGTVEFWDDDDTQKTPLS